MPKQKYNEVAEQLYTCGPVAIYDVYKSNGIHRTTGVLMAVKVKDTRGLEIHDLSTGALIHESNYQVIKTLHPAIALIYRNRVKWTH